MRTTIAIPCTLGFLVTLAGAAEAAPLLDLTGRVALLDGAVPGGTKATLGLDLNRDGTLNSFETVDVDVADDGSYAVSYTPDPTGVDLEYLLFVTQLVADYEARGFDAVLDDGPLPVVLKVEREGYTTIIKRFTTLSQAPTLDVVLAPLASIGCSGGACAAGDGSVSVSGFPGGTGIDRGYASAYDPAENTRVFPGAFTDTRANLLISSGFAEINLHDRQGNKVTSVSSPVSVRFRANPASWPSLRDLEPDSGRIEVPMYSFDEGRADWVSEAPGELVDVDGTSLAEEDLDAIHDGSHADPVFVAFQTRHFSTFNCDAPVDRRACVKGRLTVMGSAAANVQVNVNGVNYTGSAGVVVTGSDGSFATDLMKSEDPGEDADRNGKAGEVFQAQVVVSAVAGAYVGAAFDTPGIQGTVGGAVSCRPIDCDCFDLGDIDVEFETPRACSISVGATFSGENTIGSGGPLTAGDAVVDASITGQLTGNLGGLGDPAVCGGEVCGVGRADANGRTTFVVPVLGEDPHIQVKADYSVSENGTFHYYSGSVTVAGCAKGEDALSGRIDLELSHSGLSGMSSFIASLGAGPPPGSGGGAGSGGFDNPFASDDDKVGGPGGCGCRMTERSAPGEGALALFGSLAMLATLGTRSLERRRRSGLGSAKAQ